MHLYHIYIFVLFVLYYVNVICMAKRTFTPAAFAWWLQCSFLDGNETIKDENVVAAGTEQYESLTERMIEKKTLTQQTLVPMASWRIGRYAYTFSSCLAQYKAVFVRLLFPKRLMEGQLGIGTQINKEPVSLMEIRCKNMWQFSSRYCKQRNLKFPCYVISCRSECSNIFHSWIHA